MPRTRGATGSAWWRRQFARVEEAVAIRVLAAEALGQARAVRFAGHGGAPAAGQLLGGEHAVAVAVHAVEGIAHPGHVLVQRDAAIAIGVDAREIVGG